MTAAHLAANMENFDTMSLLLENGADLTIEREANMNVFAELIVHDASDLLECVWHLSKLVKVNQNKVSCSNIFYFNSKVHLVCCIFQQQSKVESV